MSKSTLTTALILAFIIGDSQVAVARSSTARGTKKDAWTIHYYTLRGAAIDFMLHYPDVFGKTIGGKPVIVRNDTLLKLEDLANRFSTRFNKDEFGGAFLGKDSQGPNTIESGSFVGKQFFVGDAHDFAGFTPSGPASDRDLRQILKGNAAWHMNAIGFGPKNSGRITFWRSSDANSLLPAPSNSPADARLIALMNHVSAGNLPFGFLLQYHTVDFGGCGDAEMADGAFPRYVDVKVAVVENTSGRIVRVTGYNGASNPRSVLRRSTQDDARLSGNNSLAFTSQVLPARACLVVPLRVAFSFSDYSFASPEEGELLSLGHRPDSSQIRACLNLVKAKRAGLEFSLGQDSSRKKASIMYSTLSAIAANPWHDPLVKEDFVYGPSYRLTSIKVDAGGAPKRGKTQSISYSTAEGFGSCPYLSVWDETRSLWLDKGRILVGRVGQGAEAYELYALSLSRSGKGRLVRVTIAEKESEETHISNIFLELTGGGKISPIEPQAILRAGESREFRFEVPHGVEGTARLHIKGYYIRTPRIKLTKSKDQRD